MQRGDLDMVANRAALSARLLTQRLNASFFSGTSSLRGVLSATGWPDRLMSSAITDRRPTTSVACVGSLSAPFTNAM
jgi:hypothetical protein